jgi:hypothetical protein
MKKILEIEYEPIATYQSLIGDLFSVISLNDSFKQWLCSNINQLVYFRDYKECEFYGMGFFYEHQAKEYQNMYFDIPIIETNKISINCIDDDIIKFIISKIDNNYYIRIPINMKEIKQVNRDYMHMIFIYGYDKEKKEMYVSNFHHGQKYNRYKYSFEEIEQGYKRRSENIEDYLEDIIYFKNKEFEYPLFIEKIKDELTAYLNSQDIYNKYKYSIRWKNCKIFFGEEYIQQLIFDVGDGRGDLRALYVLYDFIKIIDFKRIWLYENGYLKENNNEILKENLEETRNKTWLALLKWLYYEERSKKVHLKDDELKCYMIGSLLEIRRHIRRIIELLLVGLN